MVKGNQHTVIASGLSVPTGIAVGPEGNLFVSVNGYGGPPGAGMVVKIAVPHNDD
jgi:3-deoxy-D-arabino-heptulosonate 7-phosphate (DAHP) synthase